MLKDPDSGKVNIRFSNNFDFLRFFGAFLVIFSHSFVLTSGTNNGEPLFNITCILTLGGMGLLIFFVISGFLIAQSWDSNNSSIQFLWNRLLRIIPGLIGVALVTVFVIGPLVTDLSLIDYFKNPMTLNYLSIITIFNINNNLYLPGVFVNNAFPNAVNGSLWILPALFEMYILVMVAGLIGLLKKRKILLILVFILVVGYLHNRISYLMFTEPFLNSIHYITFTQFLALDSMASIFFAIGVVYYFYKDVIKYDFKIVMILALIWIFSFKTALFELISFLCVPYIILYIAHADLPPLNKAGKYGDFSYGLYIYAFPVQQTIAHFFKVSVAGMFLLTLLIVIPISFLSLKIELKALKLKKINITVIIYKNYKDIILKLKTGK